MISAILFYVILSISVLYTLLLLAYNISWFLSKTYLPTQKPLSTKISVIIPARNESENIIRCLESICLQDYPEKFYEIIVADDSSVDDTVLLVNNFIKKNSLKKIHLIEFSYSDVSGKKQVITEAIKISKGELIVTTDADCIVSSRWLSTIAEYYETYNPVMIAGLVCFYDEKTVFQNLQSLEFMSLIASGFSSAKLGLPIMCNGANMAYSKKTFIEVGGFINNSKYVSGDDVFLLLAMKKKYPGRIAFLKSRETLVKTKAQKNVSDFINQRKRWVSKSKGYKDTGIIITAFIVYLFNLSLVLCSVLSFFYFEYFRFFLTIFLIKIIVDFPFLAGILSYVKKKKLLFYYLPLQFIYMFYVVIIGITGNMGMNTWKGRRIK